LTDETSPGPGLLQRIDLLVLLSSIVLLFVALGTEPWWTLNGATTNKLLSVQISPFFLHITAVGVPSTTALSTSLGYVTRTLVLLGFVALFAGGVRPRAWWRNLAIAFGFASLVELYLSFLLMFYWAETMFVSAYSAAPPLYGTTIFQANVIGLDLTYYSRPLVTATFLLPFYLGYISMTLMLGQTVLKLFRDRALQVLKFLLPGGGIHDVYLTPPYQSVMFSSESGEFNPLGTDPQKLTDDQLIISFKKLYDTIEPGGNLSIIIPTTETTLYDRVQKIIPITGFTIEPEEIIYGEDGNPESELHFRRPEEKPEKSDRVMKEELETPPQKVPPAESPISEITASLEITPPAIEQPRPEIAAPAVLEVEQKPTWANTRMTHQEREILRAAIEILANHKEPMPYRELLNQVYLELVNSKTDFDSAKQIEAILLDHNGREVQVIEETDNEEARIVKMWGLGSEKLAKEGGHRLASLKTAKLKIPRVSSPFRKASEHYRSRKDSSDPDSPDTEPI
jgi:hypothetical protein